MAKSIAKDLQELNVYQKLLLARIKFLAVNPQKTGKNMNLSFKYFELDDIVPHATAIFNEVGLISLVNFTSDTATMTIVNTDQPCEFLEFSAPFNQIAPIVSNAGKQVTNEMQALGSSITYMRRYLYMTALDICEPDEIDRMSGTAPNLEIAAPAPAPTATVVPMPAANAPGTSLTDGNASELQITQLKAVLAKLLEAHPEKEEMVAKIAIETKGFTVISKADCEEITIEVNKMLSEEVK